MHIHAIFVRFSIEYQHSHSAETRGRKKVSHNSNERQPVAELATANRISALWTAAMFCYVYGDLIGFYIPGRIEQVAEGDLGPLGQATHGLLTGIAAIMALPALMIALSQLLPRRANRALNIIIGALYSLMMLATMYSAPPYYRLQGVIEIALTSTIVWFAWRWPRQSHGN